MTGQSATTPEWDALYDSHVLFVKELAIVSDSFDLFRIVWINSKRLKGAGAEFVRFSGMLGQGRFVTGIESLFERTNDGAGLCSVRGLLSLAKKVPLTNAAAHTKFVKKYDVKPSNDWVADVEEVLERERPTVTACLKLTSTVRNRRIAHLVQPAQSDKPAMIPGLDASEKIIEFAYDFYCFISRGFLHSQGSDLPHRAGKSLLGLLRDRFELLDALYDLPRESEPIELSENGSS